MLPQLQAFSPQRPQVQADRILRLQGYSEPARVRPAIVQAARAMAERASALAAPRVAWIEWPLTGLDDEGLTLSGGRRLRCAAFRTRLAGCSSIVPFVLTCGEPIGGLVMELADRGDLLEAVLLESAGWQCIEDATRQFKEMLRTRAGGDGCRITSRLGPGYSYRMTEAVADAASAADAAAEVTWPLEDQAALFSLFGGAELPVRLLPSSAMFPKLSRSGLFGIAPLPEVGTAPSERFVHLRSPEFAR